jgi:hypothetical protein
MKRCPKCNNVNKTQDIYCTSCGTKLGEQFQECSRCGNQNKPGSSFCNSCGNDLKSEGTKTIIKNKTPEKPIQAKKGPSGLKIFLTVIFSVIGVTIVSLAGLYLFSDFFTPEDDKEAIVSESIELLKEEMSDDQLKLLSMFGYPDEFYIAFSDEGENIRAETWIYQAIEAYFIFVDGVYDSGDRIVKGNYVEDGYYINPEDLVYGMSSEEVRFLIGEDGIEFIDPDTNIKSVSFGIGTIVAVFNPEDELMSFARFRQIESNE